jgi:hypothetical protein
MSCGNKAEAGQGARTIKEMPSNVAFITEKKATKGNFSAERDHSGLRVLAIHDQLTVARNNRPARL